MPGCFIPSLRPFFTVGLMIYTTYVLYPYTQMPSHAHTHITVSYTRFVAKSSVERIEIVRKQISDLLQALDLELLRFLFNHLPGWHNKTVVTLPCTLL